MMSKTTCSFRINSNGIQMINGISSLSNNYLFVGKDSDLKTSKKGSQMFQAISKVFCKNIFRLQSIIK